MDIVAILGFVAGTLTTIALLPQVIKVWKLKETRDLSLLMYIILCIGVILWIVYGIMLSELPIIFANGVTLMLLLSILFLKLKYG